MKMEPTQLDQPSPTESSFFTLPTAGDEDHETPVEGLSSSHDSGKDGELATDRGKHAWLAIVGGFINFWAGFGMLNSWGTFQAKYPDEPWGKNTSLSDISWIGSVQPGLLFFLGGLAGFASDKISAGILLKIGALMYAACYLLVAEYGKSFIDFLALQGFLFGLANTLLYYPATSAISDWFDRRRGLALGLVSSGSSLGGIFWPIVVDQLQAAYSMKRALQGVALIPLVPLLVASFLVRDRACRNKLTFRRIIRHVIRRDIVRPREVSDNDNGKIKLSGLKSIIQPEFLALSAACFFIYGGFLIPFNYIPLFAEYNGVGCSMANNLLAICYAGSVVGRIGTGALADRFGSFNVLCTMAFLSATLTLCWIAMRSLESMIAFAVLYGLFSGGLVPLGSACVARITSQKDMDHIGFRLGFMMMVCSVSAFGGGPLAGFLLDNEGRRSMKGWMSAFFFSGLLTLVGGAIVLAILATRLVRGSGKELVF